MYIISLYIFLSPILSMVRLQIFHDHIVKHDTHQTHHPQKKSQTQQAFSPFFVYFSCPIPSVGKNIRNC